MKKILPIFFLMQSALFAESAINSESSEPIFYMLAAVADQEEASKDIGEEGRQRRELFNRRARQKPSVEEKKSLHDLQGFFFSGRVGGSTLPSFDTNFSYSGASFDSHYSGRDAFSFSWEVSAGWMFYGYAWLGASYQSTEIPFTVFNHANNVPFFYTQNGFGSLEIQLGMLESAVLLPKIFGLDQHFIAPFIGGGVGYANTTLSAISQYNNTDDLSRDVTKKTTRGRFAYEVFAGWFFYLQQHVLMDIRLSYVDMGSIRPRKEFDLFDITGSSTQEVYEDTPTFSMKAGLLQVGFTFVL